MTEMVTVGGIRYRKADAAEQNLQADSKAHQKKVAEGEAPVGMTESAFKALNPDQPEARKAAGGRDDVNGTKTLNTSTTGNARGSRRNADNDPAGVGADGKPGNAAAQGAPTGNDK